MRSALFVIFLAVSSCYAQLHEIQVSGDAEVKVVPDEVSVFFGVENRGKDISAAVAQNNASVKRLISAIKCGCRRQRHSDRLLPRGYCVHAQSGQRHRLLRG